MAAINSNGFMGIAYGVIRRLLVFSALAFSGLTNYVAAQPVDPVLEKITRTGKLVIGYPAEALPFSYQIAEHEEPLGYSIDLCRKVAQAIQDALQLKTLTVTFQPLSFKERLDAVQSGTVDLECGSTTNTRERQEKVAFSVSTFAATIKALVRSGDPAHNLLALNHRKVIIVEGTTVGSLVSDLEKDRQLDFEKVTEPNLAAGLAALASQKGDALVFDEVVVAPRIAKLHDQYRFLSDTLAVEHLALMMPKRNPQLKRIVDTTLVTLMQSGAAEQLYRKWFQSPIGPDGTNLNIPFSQDMRVLFSQPNDRGNI
ncbi:hypothetical protein C5615_19965 [Burkholderia cepacia]|uniref:Solute-binding protein family 3/N-terminal domain-containing protein n=1 Tax=Burkholderia cepacia TaxID=292 RepID=A0A2S8INZ6_BURCE|nr:amino acid ABC transporter substrate-binding protein [Burkholderia cepacia]PQP16508.1 hypothetical protein C5615_19965 [Burkholderia cepacia]HDR9508474.1 amino acid ABC transporter substrate-binding protein [Burkholderia cepacia]